MRTSFLLFLVIGIVVAVVMPAAPTEKFAELLDGLRSLDIIDHPTIEWLGQGLFERLEWLREWIDEWLGEWLGEELGDWPPEPERVIKRRADDDGPMIMYGGRTPIRNIYHPTILGLGEWAVAEHAKRAFFNGGLKFVRVLGGEEQVVAGTQYFLLIQAINGYGISGHYKARVFDQPWTDTRELVSFGPAN